MKKIFLIIPILTAYLFANSQWIQTNGAPMSIQFAIDGNGDLFAGCALGTGDLDQIFKLNPDVLSWTQLNGPLNNEQEFHSIAISGSNIFFANDNNQFFYSNDNGSSWIQLTNGLPAPGYSYGNALAISGNNIFAGANGVFLSTDTGNSWSAIDNGLPIGFNILSLAISGSNIYAALDVSTPYNPIYLSTNNGSSWTEIGGMEYIKTIATNGNSVYVGGKSGIEISNDNGNSWTGGLTGLGLCGIDVNARAFAFSGTNIFVGTRFGNSCPSGGVFLSTDNGNTWTAINTGLTVQNGITALAIKDNYLFAGGEDAVWKRALSEMIPAPNNCSASFTLYPDVNTPHNWYVLDTVTGVLPITYSWDWGDGNFSTGNNPSHTYNTPGYYNICLTITDADGCSAMYCNSSTYVYKTDAEIITINVVDELPTGIKDFDERQVSISPNPAISEITINGYMPTYLKLYNTIGQKVIDANNTNKLFVGTIPKGIYILQLFDSNGNLIIVNKIIKE